MRACERCGDLVLRRTRCAICRRLCCVQCIDWPRMAGGVRWCRQPKHVEHVMIEDLDQTGCDKTVHFSKDTTHTQRP